MNNKIDITSTALEKGLDIARDFLGKLIYPSIEEAGLLLKDTVTLWRLRNQIKVLEKAKIICERNNIEIKAISIKLLCPLLENASLEEDEFLQDKWANLLSNLVDSDQNITNQIFPYLLSQLSKEEFEKLDRKFILHKSELLNLNEKISSIETKINELSLFIQDYSNKLNDCDDLEDAMDIHSQITSYEHQITSFEEKKETLKLKMKKSISVKQSGFNEFELTNLIRLGIVKYSPALISDTQTITLDQSSNGLSFETDLDIQYDSYNDYIITGMGEYFIKICQEKIEGTKKA